MGAQKAKAPRPGVGRRNEEADAAGKILELKIRGNTYNLALGALSGRDRIAFRQALGMPYEEFMSMFVTVNEDGTFGMDERQFGMDIVMVMCWLARRRNGEPTLSFDQADREFPWDLTIEEAENGGFSFDLIDPTGTDPEA